MTSSGVAFTTLKLAFVSIELMLHFISLERLARDERSSLLAPFVSFVGI